MGEQKNLFLAIAISIAIIVIFQFLFPQQTVIQPTQIENISENSLTSIDQEFQSEKQGVQTKEEIIPLNKRVEILTSSLKGSINLKGAVLDDLILLNYKESLDKNSKNITLLAPEKTKNPYYIEIGWKSLNQNQNDIELPNLETQWKTS